MKGFPLLSLFYVYIYISFIHIDFKPCITEWDYVVYDCVCMFIFVLWFHTLSEMTK